MKKILILVLSLALVLAALTPVLAEESPLRLVVDNIAEVLMDMDNVTVTGTAEFSLDGEWFKSVDTSYKQCGTRSVWKLDLLSPTYDGEKKASGWTIIADDEKLHVIEVLYPGTFITGTGTALIFAQVDIRLMLLETDALHTCGSLTVANHDLKGVAAIGNHKHTHSDHLNVLPRLGLQTHHVLGKGLMGAEQYGCKE